MSLLSHTLQAGGAIQTLAAWGITSCVVRGAAGGQVSLQFALPRLIDAPPLFYHGQTMILRDGGGVIRFVGTLRNPTREVASGGSESRSYTVQGPAKRLDEITYQQPWTFVVSPEQFAAALASIRDQAPTAEEAAGAAWAAQFEPGYTGRVILNRKRDGSHPHVRQQVGDILAYAINPVDGESGAGVVFDTSALPAVLPPVSQELDLSCLEAITRQMAWVPGYTWRWEFATGTPVARFGSITAGNDFGAVRTLDLTPAGGVVVEWLGTPRWELLVRQVVLTYLYGDTQQDPDDDSAFVRLVARHVAASTVALNGSQIIVRNTVVLSGPVVTLVGGEKVTAEGEPIPNGPELAEQLHAPFRRPYFGLRWSQTQAEVDWSIQPGQRWNVAGATEEFATAEAVCQTVEWDIAAGATRVECGPPTQLGLGSILDLKRPNRQRKQGEAAAEQQYGFASAEKGDTTPPEGSLFPGYDPVSFDLCDPASGSDVPGSILFKAD